VNKFFRLFGEDFASKAKERVAIDDELSASVKPFISIGWSRNVLVHSDFVSFPLTETLSELIEQYRTALGFVAALRAMLTEDPAWVGSPN
jgi:hypothetical protein